MALARKPERRYSPEAYLKLEEGAESKSEFLDGVIYAMTGGSLNHNRIAGGFYAALRAGLQGRTCEAFGSDLRLWIPAHNMFTYPDAMVICGSPEFLPKRNDTVVNPRLILEVLSKSTQDYDRGRKFEFYRSIPALCDYVLANQDRIYVEYYHKLADGRWLLTEIDRADDTLHLEGIELTVSIQSIYATVDWWAA
jgi:Uma2 family endonuclease